MRVRRGRWRWIFSTALSPNAALGRVDDAFKGKVVGGLVDDAQIGDGIADFGAFVKAETADDLVVQPDLDEAVFKFAGLELRADEDGDGVEADACLCCSASISSPIRRASSGPSHTPMHADLFAAIQLGPQGLAQPSAVGVDQAGCGGKDMRGGAVILFQPDDLCAGKILFKPQDIGNFCAAP